MCSRIVRLIVLIALCIMQGSYLYAQQPRYFVDGVVWPHLENSRSDESLIFIRPISGAVVTLETPSDTSYSVSDDFGRFFFRKISSRYFTLKVKCMGYETWSKEFDGDTLKTVYGGIRVELREEKETLEAAVVKDEAPVFEFVGDTLKYNVAATQQLSEDDMLKDVFDRLPGISVTNNLVEIMGEEVSRIYVDGRLVFGEEVGNPLRYLAGSEVISLKVYDQPTREERLGLAPKGSKKERVVNVVTKSKIKTALIAQAIAGYGRNFENTGSETDNRYAAGATGNWFSEMNLLSFNVYLNNVGRGNEYSSVSDISSIPSAYSRVGYAGAKIMRKFNDAELGDVLSASYSYGNTKSISESSLVRTYSPDDNWTSRTYEQDRRSLSRKDAHNVQLSFMTFNKYIPAVDVSFSAAGNDMNSVSRLENIVDGDRSGYNQLMTENGDEYRYTAGLSKIFPVGKSHLMADIKFAGGHSFGGSLQRDTTLETSAVTAYVSEPQGRNADVDARLSINRPVLKNKYNIGMAMMYRYQYSSVNRLRYADAVAEANLDRMTSDVHTYNYDTYSMQFSANSQAVGPFTVNVSLIARYDRQRRDVTMPQQKKDGLDYFSLLPSLNFMHLKGVAANTSLGLYASPVLPSFEQIRSDFDAANPMYVTRGNPALKKSTNCVFQMSGSYMLGRANSLNVVVQASYLDNKITEKTRYFTEDTVVDGYEMSKGTTYMTYDNLDGSMSAQTKVMWNTRLRPLKLTLSTVVSYDFMRDPSYVEERLNIAHRHNPSLTFNVSSNFSRKYDFSLKTRTAASFVYNSRYSDVSYLDQGVSFNSRNKITDWMFVNAEYHYSLRYPFQDTGNILQDHMLNAIVGFRLKKSGVELNLTCYDILNMTSSFRTTVQRNYTQTSFTPDFGRIWMVTAVWRFNSTQRGGADLKSRFINSPQLGRDYENTRYLIKF